MAKQKIRIRLKAYDHRILDQSAEKIVETAKQTRLANFNKAIQEKLDAVENGTADVGKMNEELFNKTGFPLTYNEYTEEDITFKKGTFDYWITERQLYPQNEINKHSLNYMVCWFACLMDMGYGKTRLQRVQDFFDKLLEDYRVDKTSVRAMHSELIAEGIYVEQPIDPLTRKSGSMMTM